MVQRSQATPAGVNVFTINSLPGLSLSAERKPMALLGVVPAPTLLVVEDDRALSGMLAELFTDQLSADQHVHFAHLGRFPSLGFGLAGALTREPSTLATAAAVGELQ